MIDRNAPKIPLSTTELERRLQVAVSKFKTQVLEQGFKPEYYIPIPSGVPKKVVVTSTQIQASLTSLTKRTRKITLLEDLRFHLRQLEMLLPFSSSPTSFSSSWNLRSKVLTKEIANRLANEGAQLIPVNEKERIFKTDQQGVQYGRNTRLILGVRHSQGNYDDELDNLGRFTYQPPNNTKGMMSYRWLEILQQELGIPLVIIVIIWFEYRINEKLNHVFVVSPATIIDFEGNVSNFKESLSKPIRLKIIERSEAYNYIEQLNALDRPSLDIKVRRSLYEDLANEWSYSQINNLKKGNRIKEWAKNKGLLCPGELCNHIAFKYLKNSDIAFGHIVPQNWAYIFPHHISNIHHPDNLYLTCSSCNSQLRDDFPNINLRNTIVRRSGTIGDWIRHSNGKFETLETDGDENC